MSDPSSLSVDPTFEREKWEADLRLREREVAVKEQEVASKDREHELKRHELDAKIIDQRRAKWRDPLVLAVLAAALAAAGNAVVASISSDAQLALERSKVEGQQTIEETKAEAARILEVIKTIDPEKAAQNLDFLLKAGLITNEARRTDLERFLKQRQPGQGPSIPPQSSQVAVQRPPIGRGITCRLSKPYELPVLASSLARALDAPPISAKSEISSIPDGMQVLSRAKLNLSAVGAAYESVIQTELRHRDNGTEVQVKLKLVTDLSDNGQFYMAKMASRDSAYPLYPGDPDSIGSRLTTIIGTALFKTTREERICALDLNAILLGDFQVR